MRSRRLSVILPILLLIAATLVLVLRLVLPSARTPYLDLLREGDEHAIRLERTAAVMAYGEAARLWPSDPSPHLRMARVYLDWRRTDEALLAIDRAERLGAEGLDLEELWLEVYKVRGDWFAVLQHGRRLLALAPPDTDEVNTARHALGRAYEELSEWDAAQVEYEELLRADANDSRAHERLGVLLMKDHFTATQHLIAAGTDLSTRLLAVLQEPSVAYSPAYANALAGRILVEAEEWALATLCFKRAVLDSPDYADAHAYLGYTLDQMGNPGEALPHLLRAVALAPDSAAVHTFMGLHYDRLGDTAAARAEYEKAYDLDPDNPATCIEIGQTWAAEGRYVAAEIWLQEAVSLEPDEPLLWQVLVRFYLDHNVTAEGRALEAATELVGLAPDDARAHDLQGWAALQVGDYDTARNSLLEAISLEPTLASAHYHLGLLWAAEGAHEEAREAFINSLDLDVTGALVPLVERVMSGG